MVKEFKIGSLYIVNNPFNTDGVHFNDFTRAPNGTVLPLFKYELYNVEQIFGTPDNKDYYMFCFMHDGVQRYCTAYLRDMVRYFDEVK